MRVVSGVQPSGRLHLGNWFGALRQFVELQERAECFFFLADLHALTSAPDAARLRDNVRALALDFLALGLDPARSTLFRQSDVPEVLELYWVLGNLAPVALLERGHGYKDKTARGIPANLGLFAYPVLMAADILLYRADAVPVGRDQKQHLEIARDLAVKFNQTRVPGFDPQDPDGLRGGAAGLLRLPEPLIRDESAVVPGTDGRKMSKTYGNTIDLFADEGVLRRSIAGVVTDSTPVAAPKDPSTSTLFALLSLLLDPSEVPALERSFREGGTGYGEYKKRLLDALLSRFSEARRRRAELERDPGRIDRVLVDGANRARAAAGPVMDAVRRACGLR